MGTEFTLNNTVTSPALSYDQKNGQELKISDEWSYRNVFLEISIGGYRPKYKGVKLLERNCWSLILRRQTQTEEINGCDVMKVWRGGKVILQGVAWRGQLTKQNVEGPIVKTQLVAEHPNLNLKQVTPLCMRRQIYPKFESDKFARASVHQCRRVFVPHWNKTIASQSSYNVDQQKCTSVKFNLILRNFEPEGSSAGRQL
jgi:hypothetical protein